MEEECRILSSHQVDCEWIRPKFKTIQFHSHKPRPCVSFRFLNKDTVFMKQREEQLLAHCSIALPLPLKEESECMKSTATVLH